MFIGHGRMKVTVRHFLSGHNNAFRMVDDVADLMK